MAPIYVELVKNRRAQADYYGEADYSAMQDRYTYSRDYDAEDIAAFSRTVKEEIVPLTQALSQKVSDYAAEGAYDTVFTEETLLDALRDGLSSVSPELLPALNYMETYGYYDIAESPTKASVAYTDIFVYAGAPFLLMQPEGSDYDFTSIVHEFGHYNAFYCSDDPLAYSIDLSEIHSQGLELLMLPHYESVFGRDADAERLYTVYAILTSLVDGCMMNELERYAYSLAEPTVELLNEKYMDLLKDYGYRDRDDPETMAYDWVLTSHLFSEPLYYISYGVSAAAALEIWERSLTDREGAVKTYLELVALGETGEVYKTLSRAGLSDPMNESRIREIAAAAKRETALPSSPQGEVESAGSDMGSFRVPEASAPALAGSEAPAPVRAGIPLGWVVLIALGCYLLGVGGAVLVLSRRR